MRTWFALLAALAMLFSGPLGALNQKFDRMTGRTFCPTSLYINKTLCFL